MLYNEADIEAAIDKIQVAIFLSADQMLSLYTIKKQLNFNVTADHML